MQVVLQYNPQLTNQWFFVTADGVATGLLAGSYRVAKTFADGITHPTVWSFDRDNFTIAPPEAGEVLLFKKRHRDTDKEIILQVPEFALVDYVGWGQDEAKATHCEAEDFYWGVPVDL